MNRFTFLTLTIVLCLISTTGFNQEFIETIDGLWGGDELIGESAAFYDIDNDGNQDVIIGHDDGTLSHYEQSSGPDFTKFLLISDDFNNIDVGPYRANPVMVDINNDGLIELIVGNYYGELDLFMQSSPNSIDFVHITDEYNGIDVHGGYAAPTFTDLDNDGLLDLVVGNYYGDLYHYEQDATDSFEFTLMDDYFNNIDIGSHSVPYFTDINSNGLLDLSMGQSDGKVSHYEQDAVNSLNFTYNEATFDGIDIGSYSSPLLRDFDNDGLLEMLIGEDGENGFNLYRQNAINSMDFNVVSNNLYSFYDFGSSVIPTVTDIDNDDFLDLIVGDGGGTLLHYEQTTLNTNDFSLVTQNFSNIDIGGYSCPAFTDLDGDGLLDLLIGELGGNLYHYEQAAPLASFFVLVDNNFNGINISEAKPCFTDLNNNGLIDLVIGENYGKLYYYEQDSPFSLIFNLINDNLSSIDVGYESSPSFTLEEDGLYSLVVGNSSGYVRKYLQSTISADTFHLVSNNYFEKVFGGKAAPIGIDITGNGFTDYFVGNSNGLIHHFQTSMDCVTLVEPLNNSVANEQSPQLAWNHNQSASGYLIYFGTDNPPSNILNGFDNGSDTVFTLSPLALEQEYYWSVRAYTAADTSEMCKVWSFTTIDLMDLPYVEWNNLSVFPNNINVETNLTTENVWSHSNSSNAGGINFELMAQNINEIGEARMILPIVNTSGLSTIELQFNQFFDDLAPGLEMRIESSSDGLSWTTEAWSQQSGSGNYGPETISTTIDSNVGSVTYVSFLLSGDFNSFDAWYLDNFYLFDPNDLPPLSFPINPNSFSIVEKVDTLKWYESPNTDNYLLFVGSDNPPTNILNGITVSDPYYLLNNNIPFRDTLYWQVVPQNSIGEAVNTETWTFKTDTSSYFWGKATNFSKPIFSDFDHDGNFDLLIGVGSHMEHYKQSSTDPFEFKFVNENFNNIPSSNCVIYDIDNDGLLDLLTIVSGKMHHYVQESAKSTKFSIVSDYFSFISDNQLANPTITDLDNDNLLDLVIGCYGGYMYHYEQRYESSLEFNFVSNDFSGIEVCNYCDAAPTFTDPDKDGYLDLYIGTNSDGIKHYKQSTYNLNSFYFEDEENFQFDPYPTFTDIDHDGLLNYIIGRQNGRFFHKEQTAAGSFVFDSITDHFLSNIIDVGRNSKPIFLDIDNNNKLDAFIGNEDGKITHYEADSPNSFKFNLISSEFSWIDVEGGAYITSTDIDNDNLIDLIIGGKVGSNHSIYRYEQVAPASLIFNLVTENFLGVSINQGYPAFKDIDDDGLLDMLIGDYYGMIQHYEQDAISSSNFVFVTDNFDNIDVGWDASPCFHDIDYDGLIDLIIGDDDGNVIRYEQDSVNAYTFTIVESIPLEFPVSTKANPTVADIDNDGIFDLIVGDNNGGILHTRLDLPCTLLASPEDGQMEVSINTQLTWNKSTAADGYLLSFGTDNPPTNILNAYDMGTDTVLSPASLEYDQTYYWQVSIYKGADTSLNCPVRSFSTKVTYNLPYTIFSDSCEMPFGWIQESTTDSILWSIQNTIFALGKPCELQAQSVNATGTSRFISPALPTLGIDTLVVQFNHFFDDMAPGLDLKIESSTDGEIWTTESWSQQSGSGNIGPATENLEITNNLGDHTFISFTIEGDHNSFNHWYLDDIYIFDKHGKPPCTYPIQPENAAIVLAIDTLKWKQPPITDNYKFFMGTDFPPTNIYNDSTVVDTYFVPEILLPLNDTIFWQVVPVNVNGDGLACETWSFYIEFEGVFPPTNLQAVVQDYYDVHLSWSEPAVSSQDSVLIIDLDDNLSSGPEIFNTVTSHGIPTLYSTTFPDTINDYAAVFVCLGIYPNYTILGSLYGQLLAGYLNNGGNLYMEGGDTWAYNSPTAVHPMFNIDGVADGTDDMAIVVGQAGTFTENMIFSYSGENGYMDHIAPFSPAFMIFENQSPNYGTCVAYDAGTYKTIGAAHEFGGLDDGTFPSTREELMVRYLEFFGLSISKTTEQKGFIGYNVYRNNTKLNPEPVIDLYYDDMDLAPDLYDYYVTTLYDEGESTPSNIEPVIIENHNFINLKVFLEGPFYEGEMTPYLNAFELLPLSQPYNAAPWNYPGLESVSAIPDGNVIDWILVELRETNGDASTAVSATIIAKQACFLLMDGSVVDTSGHFPPEFKVPINEDLYIVIHHRNHLSIMSSEPLSSIDHIYNYDFSDSETKVYGGSLGYQQLDTNMWGMFSGDGNADKQINNVDKNDIWFLHYGEVGYFKGDYDMNSFDYIQDIGEKWKNNSGKASQVPE